MKKCPYCAEEIQGEAVICRYCHKKVKGILFKHILQAVFVFIVAGIVALYWIKGRAFFTTFFDEVRNTLGMLKGVMVELREGLELLKSYRDQIGQLPPTINGG